MSASERTYLKNLTTGECVVFDNIKFVLTRMDSGPVSARHSEYSGADQLGVLLADSSVGKRQIAIEGYIISASQTELYGLKRRLSRVTNPLECFSVVQFIGGDGFTLKCASDSGIIYSHEPVFTAGNSARFTLKATAYEPFWTSADVQVSDFDRYAGMFVFPASATSTGTAMGCRSSDGVIMLINDGDLSAGCKVSVECGADVEYFKIENAATHEYLKVTGASESGVISAGEQLEFVTHYGEKAVTSLKNGVRTNIMHRLDTGSTFFRIPAGSTYFTYETDLSAEEGKVRVSVAFSPLFLID